MASIYRNRRGWRAQVCVKGQRDSATFATRAETAAWALEREAELSGDNLPSKRLSDALARYEREVSPTHAGERWERARLRKFGRHALAKRLLSGIGKGDIADWREERLGEVAPASVRREMKLLNSVFEAARQDWGWLRENPMKEVRKPKEPPSRRRRITDKEIDRIARACGLGDGYAAETAKQRVGLAFLFAIETAMRSGEIVGLQWPRVHVKERFVHLPKTKNGDARDVPLSSTAAAILEALPAGNGPVFGLTDGVRDILFREARDAAQIPGLHFHDSRAEAIWRLSKKLDVLQLARMIGHRDPRSLMLYYSESASDTAKQLA